MKDPKQLCLVLYFPEEINQCGKLFESGKEYPVTELIPSYSGDAVGCICEGVKFSIGHVRSVYYKGVAEAQKQVKELTEKSEAIDWINSLYGLGSFEGDIENLQDLKSELSKQSLRDFQNTSIFRTRAQRDRDHMKAVKIMLKAY